jgi:anti-sigma B factor antagonist
MITLGEAVSSLHDHSRDVLEGGTTRLVLDLSEVRYADSSGLGEMAAVLIAFRNRGGNVVAAKLSHKLTDLFRMTKWDTFLRVFPEIEAAVAFLKTDQPIK